MSTRRFIVIAAAWLATVAGVSSLTWSVISSAGATVGQPISVPVPSQSGSGGLEAETGQSWMGAAGRVTVRCNQDQVSIGAAVPAVGYGVEIKDPGPERLRLEFEPEASGAGAEMALEVTCHAGVPQFVPT